MTTIAYLKLLARNRFRIHILRWAMAIIILLISPITTSYVLLQGLIWGRKIRQTEIDHPPVFVIGHWRSGTTLLHELLSLDERHSFPSTYECFAPKHFLLTSWIIPKLFWFILPASRPMDEMPADFEAPQEDEFALVSMGAPSPYFRMAFCNEQPPFEEFYNMDAAGQNDVEVFSKALSYFFKALTYKKQKRLILKSPTHTGRIAYLAKLFPGAKFIHISRNPCSQIPSTMRTWQTLDAVQGFQFPKYSDEELLQYCFDVFDKMYGGYLRQVEEIPKQDIYELRFEDLIGDPVNVVGGIYQAMQFDNYASIAPKVREYFDSRRDYQRRKYELDDAIKAKIVENCSQYIERFDY